LIADLHTRPLEQYEVAAGTGEKTSSTPPAARPGSPPQVKPEYESGALNLFAAFATRTGNRVGQWSGIIWRKRLRLANCPSCDHLAEAIHRYT
jgi:hypothetical protein